MIFFCSFIAYAALAKNFNGCGHYRMVFEPLLLILSTVGITNLFNVSPQKKIPSCKKVCARVL